MKNIYFYLVIIAIGLIINTRSNAQNAKPEKVYSFVKVEKSAAWYKEQADLWKKEIDKNSKNANAWYNYYKAMRYYRLTTDSSSANFTTAIAKKIVDIMDQMEKKIPDSYEFNLLKYSNGDLDISLYPYLKKAYNLDPDRVDAYPDLAAYYETVRDTANLKKIMNKWYSANDFSAGFMNFNYNSLMPLDKNAIFIVNGDDIVYPSWVLQYVMGIRTDVKIVLAYFLDIDTYRESILKELNIEPFKKKISDFPDHDKYSQTIMEYIVKNAKDRPVYFSVTLENYFYEKMNENLYNEGLVYKYSVEKYDNIAVLKKNYEKIFLKDYINYDFTNDVSQSIVDLANLNYFPSFLTLYDHYKTSGDNDKANEIKTLTYDILNKNKSRPIDEYLKLVKEKMGEE